MSCPSFVAALAAWGGGGSGPPRGNDTTIDVVFSKGIGGSTREDEGVGSGGGGSVRQRILGEARVDLGEASGRRARNRAEEVAQEQTEA